VARESDLEFVQFAVRHGFVDDADARACLEIQQRLAAVGFELPIGEVMKENGYLDDVAVARILGAIDGARPAPPPGPDGLAAGPTAPSPAGPPTAPGTTAVLYRRGAPGASPADGRRRLKEWLGRVAPTAPRARGPVGPTFGRFRIVEALGHGGMADVYRVVDGDTREERALKVIRDDFAGEPLFLGRFCLEAANTLLVDHPNVVRLEEIGVVDDRPYFTLEVIEGETLRERMTAASAIDEGEALEVLRQVALALRAIHAAGLVHRDVKPGNVVLTDATRRYGAAIEGETELVVKVVDFGLSRAAGEPEVSDARTLLATAKYLAPELVRREEDFDGRADIFSLGICAYQMLAGVPPFAATTSLQQIEANLRAEATPLLDLKPDLEPALGRLVGAMIAKDPSARPAAAAVAIEIERLQAMRARRLRLALAAPPGEGDRKPRPERAAPGLDPAARAGKPPLRATALIIAAAVLAAALAAGAIGFALGRLGEERRGQPPFRFDSESQVGEPAR